jgi:predicted  nucleic acid-binding Zn-ribbon protein
MDTTKELADVRSELKRVNNKRNKAREKYLDLKEQLKDLDLEIDRLQELQYKLLPVGSY